MRADERKKIRNKRIKRDYPSYRKFLKFYSSIILDIYSLIHLNKTITLYYVSINGVIIYL